MAITRFNRVSPTLVLALGFVALLFHGTAAQSGCMTTLLGLSPCLNYVSGNTSTPSSTCCSRLSGVVQSQPQCLCLLLNGTASSYGYNINQTQALALPGACNVKTPSVSLCNGSPSSSPSSSPSNNTPADHTPATSATPTDHTPATSATPAVPSGTGSKTTPTTTAGGSTSDASMNQKLSLFSVAAVALLFARHFSAVFGF